MNSRTEQLLKSYLPMSEQSFLLLLCLTQPRHGYGIMQFISSQTDGRITLGASTVYTLLYKMEQDRLVEVVSEVERRKVYSITDDGMTVLKAEADRLRSLANYAFSVLEEEPQPQTT
ncbi:MAG: helix-turn-helix transcriptional regulator [Oscillospiraceae bacterium]|nr:helix-turn-helix transcriptional regulator [Oscillospiraceae bacterium]MBP1577903.1 helix-turn-helix transcriptional regulator [Oscillospiraceae bacterium]